MTITFADIFGNGREILPDEDNFILPDSGKISIKDAIPNSCILNHKVLQHNADFDIPVERHDLTISLGANTYRIKVLCGEISQENIIDYQDIYKTISSYSESEGLTYENLEKVFDVKNDGAVRLCSFNKKFEHLARSSNRDEILKNVKYLPHIFYRPKRHLRQINEVRPAAIVTRIGTESIRHLASHSEHWKGIKASGLVPERLLARILEDDYAIYENVAVKTLVDRLYSLEKKEKEDTIDCKINFNIADSYAPGNEVPNFFKAVKFLFKGVDISESSITQNLIDEALKTIQAILTHLSKCKSTELYRQFRQEKEIKGPLKKTNIFMMDNYYKKVYKLWNLLGKQEEIFEISEKKNIADEYLLYAELIILFCLEYMGFTPEDKTRPVLIKNAFADYSCRFRDWKITLNTKKAKLFDAVISAEISLIQKIHIKFAMALPESPAYKKFHAKKINNEIIFDKKLNDKEQSSLCEQLLINIERGRQAKWKQEFRKTLFDEMNKITNKSEKILFIPWKYGIADDYKAAKETVKQIKELISSTFGENEYDECYVLNATRPNELKNIDDEGLLKSLVSYSLRNQESPKQKDFGIIPISLNDINSFRRIAKIFLKNMIILKDEQNICPHCGSSLKGDEAQGYSCANQSCEFKIYNTQCPDCKKKYWYTDYRFPKALPLDAEHKGEEHNKGIEILLHESKLGFKNITELIDNHKPGKHKPECPYCNNANTK